MQTAPAAVTIINPDTRPLPPGWSSLVDQTGSWFYVNTNSAPPQLTYNHPSGPNPAPKVPNDVQMTKDQQLSASALSPHLFSTSVLGPAPLPPGAALPTPPGAYTSSTGIMSVSHSSKSANQQPQRPTLAQASVTSTGQMPVQKQSIPTAMPMYVQTPPPNHTAYVPAVPYSMASGYMVTVPLQNPNPSPPQPTAYGLLTADVAARKKEGAMQTFKEFGKAALEIADAMIQATTTLQNMLST